jgi:hypothetical protein
MHLCVLHERTAGAEPVDGSATTYLDQIDAQSVLNTGGEAQSGYTRSQHVER